jgi:hypothetical protein
MQLQTGEGKTLKAIDKMIDPPMVAPPSLKNLRSSLLPNDVTYLEETQTAQFRPAHAVNFNIQAMEGKQEQVRTRIIKAYYADLFLMLANSDRRQVTATEIEEKKEEKLLALGPVLENLNTDFLDILIDIMFSYLEKQGKLTEPPEELLEAEIKVEYISIMAQAQKSLGLASMDRLFGMVANLAQIDPNAVKKINTMEFINEFAESVGTPQRIIRSNEDYEGMIQAEQEALQQQQQIDQMQQEASAAKEMSETDVEGDNALTKIIQGQ